MKLDQVFLWFVFAVAIVLLAFVFHSQPTSAALSFDSSGGSNLPSFNSSNINLLQPLTDFINGLKSVAGNITSVRLPSYVGSGGGTVNGGSIAPWLNNFFQNIPVLNQIYLIFVKIISLAANLIIWILQFVIDLLMKGLSFLK